MGFVHFLTNRTHISIFFLVVIKVFFAKGFVFFLVIFILFFFKTIVLHISGQLFFFKVIVVLFATIACIGCNVSYFFKDLCPISFFKIFLVWVSSFGICGVLM